MNHYYAFNGDADGLCALQQLRLADPEPATLITGVKRDIQLLQRIEAKAGDAVTVLDVSLDQNRKDLLLMLESGISVRYFDHHHAGELPSHLNFISHIDEAADVCTSVLVDRHLGGRHRAWAITAAFGDSLPVVGRAMAAGAGIDEQSTSRLEQLGICLNYNAYGETISDLHFDPSMLAAHMLPYADPLEFIRHSEVFQHLAAGYEDDMWQARQLEPVQQLPGARLFILPDEAWARRAIGVLANELMLEQPDCALGLLSPKGSGGFIVSVRVPGRGPLGAAEFCRLFETGGGRKLSGGINHLPPADVDRFASSFAAHFGAQQSR